MFTLMGFDDVSLAYKFQQFGRWKMFVDLFYKNS